MFDWFDLMRQAQKSAGTAMLAKQFHLDGDQTQAAMAAFLPAFAMGMQHAMGAKPDDAMVQNLFGGAYQNLWLNAAQAFSPGSQRNGQQILDQIFGSDEISRRVAQQAAEMTGVNADVMQQMLPVLAGIYAGGLYHWMSGQTRAMNKAAAACPAAGPPCPISPNPGRACAPRGLGAAARQSPRPAATPFEAMMAGFLPPAPTRKPPLRRSRRERNRRQDKPPAWEEMMEKGRDMQKQYLASLQSIFDEAEKARPPRSADLGAVPERTCQAEPRDGRRRRPHLLRSRRWLVPSNQEHRAIAEEGLGECALDLAARQADIAEHPVIEFGELADFAAVPPAR